MKFSIITPTHKRVDKLIRAVESVLDQTCSDWEMIIVNDSPDDTSYGSIEKTITDSRIVYLKNKQNMGVNYSRNVALNNLSADSLFIIFLDDDDWFAKDTLENFTSLINSKPSENWFVSNRILKDGTPLTSTLKNNTHYSYVWDYLIFKKIKGDATHCIRASVLKNIKFLKSVKQGEEWFFFYQLGLKNRIFYHSHNSTHTEGYNTLSGLNFRKRPRIEQYKTLQAIGLEGFHLHLICHPTFFLYLSVRLIRILLNSNK